MSQVGDGLNAERALATLDHQVVLTEAMKNNVNVLQMAAPRIIEDQNVVKENEHKVRNEIMEHNIHHSLERRRSIGEAEQHDQKLKVCVMGAERRLGDVSFVHTNLMVATANPAW
jgi:hypothetical protein